MCFGHKVKVAGKSLWHCKYPRPQESVRLFRENFVNHRLNFSEDFLFGGISRKKYQKLPTQTAF
jgi:hypothetical protein